MTGNIQFNHKSTRKTKSAKHNNSFGISAQLLSQSLLLLLLTLTLTLAAQSVAASSARVSTATALMLRSGPLSVEFRIS